MTLRPREQATGSTIAISGDEDYRTRRFGGKIGSFTLDISLRSLREFKWRSQLVSWMNEPGVQGRASRLEISIHELSVIRWYLKT